MALFPKSSRSDTLYRDLLTGKFFRDRGILNLAEPDFFSWALDTKAEAAFFAVLDALFKRLGEFEWTKITEDLLKMLYQELIDPSDRSGLGEFYTPDWLAELMLQDIRYKKGTLLDPACGSGTFLFAGINLLRENGLHGKKLVDHVMESIVGLDVHPVAILMAKANVLLALAPELKEKRDYDVHLSVYMADTLQTAEKKGKNYLAVPDGCGHDFRIPLKSIEFNRDLDAVIDSMTTFAHRAIRSDALMEQARKGFLGKIKHFTNEEINLWNVNFALMASLIGARQDTVWGFILKNAYRPAYLRRTKVDVVIGNPPWLSFRDIAEPSYKKRIKELTFGYELLKPKERNLFTQIDTSTLFFIHCKEEFLRKSGKIAFVMPKTTVLPSKQHAGFQQHGVSAIHDFSKVFVAGLRNQHFFNVSSCVVIDSGDGSTADIPMTVWEGVLPRKNLALRQAENRLSKTNTTHDFLSWGIAKSPYYERAMQGATLNPHTLWLVEPDMTVPLNTSRPMLKTSETAHKLCKEKKWKLRVKGTVEKDFLFATALSHDILPFFVRGLTLCVLPIASRDGHYVLMNSEEILGGGFEYASDWVRRAERIFRKRSKDEELTAQGRLNYQKLLSEQDPKSRFTVLYNKSGTNISCAYLSGSDCLTIGHLPVKGFVAESVTYRLRVASEEEAQYLTAMLNSGVVNKAIKPYQTEGLYGKRDIHRRPFEICPIPEFSPSNADHLRLVELASAARSAIKKWGPSMEGRLAKVRDSARQLVAPELSEIDDIVAKMFGDSNHIKEIPERHDEGQAQMFG